MTWDGFWSAVVGLVNAVAVIAVWRLAKRDNDLAEEMRQQREEAHRRVLAEVCLKAAAAELDVLANRLHYGHDLELKSTHKAVHEYGDILEPELCRFLAQVLGDFESTNSQKAGEAFRSLPRAMRHAAKLITDGLDSGKAFKTS